MMKTLNSPKLPLGEINFNTFKKATSTSKSSNMASQQHQIVKNKNTTNENIPENILKSFLFKNLNSSQSHNSDDNNNNNTTGASKNAQQLPKIPETIKTDVLNTNKKKDEFADSKQLQQISENQSNVNTKLFFANPLFIFCTVFPFVKLNQP